MKSLFRQFAFVAVFVLVVFGSEWRGMESLAGEKDSPKAQKVRTDIHGDPMPSGALARLGSLRWRDAEDLQFVTFSADGKSLITTDANGRCSVWDRSTGKTSKTFGPIFPARKANANPQRFRSTRLNQQPLCVGTSEDNKIIVIAKGKKITVWNTSTGKKTKEFKGVAQDVHAVALSNATGLLAWQESSGQLHLVNWKTGKEAAKLGTKKKGENQFTRVSIYGNSLGALLKFSPDGKVLCSGAFEAANVNNGRTSYGYLQALDLWDTKTGKAIGRIKAEGAGRTLPLAVSFSADSKQLVSSFSTGTLELYDAKTAKKVRTFQTKGGIFTRNLGNQQVVTPDGRTLVVWNAMSSTLSTYDIKTGKTLREFTTGASMTRVSIVVYNRNQTTNVTLAVSPDSKTAALLDTSGTIRFIDLTTGKESQKFPGHSDKVTFAAYLADGKTIATMSKTGSVRFWDAKTGKQKGKFLPPRKNTTASRLYAASYRLSRDGSTLAVADMSYNVGGISRNVALYDTKTKKQLPKIKLPEPDNQARRSIYSQSTMLALSPDGKQLAVVMSDGGTTAYIYDTRTGKQTKELFVKTAPVENPNGRGFVVSSRNQSLGLLAFSPDGNLLAISEEKKIGFWDIAQGKKLSTIPVPQVSTSVRRTRTNLPNTIEGATFSPDSRMFGLVFTNGKAEVYEAVTGEKRVTFAAPKRKKQNPNPDELIARTYVYSRLFNIAPEYLALAFSPDSRVVAFRNGTNSTIQFADLRTGKQLSQMITGHTGKILALAFAPDHKTFTTTSEDTTGLVWDVAAIQTKLSNKVEPLTDAQIQQHWKNLGNIDGKIAFQAINALVKNSDETVKVLAKTIRPTAPVDPKQIAKLIEQLDAEKFRTRITAYTKLQKLGIKAKSQLQEAQKKDLPQEVRTRIRNLLDAIADRPLNKNELQVWRAIEVLERINTEKSKEVLARLAQGAPGVFPTTVAEEALERLKK